MLPSSVQPLWVHPYKLIPPRAPEPVLERTRLETLLDQAWAYPLTLLQGPPGQGKTTLLVRHHSKTPTTTPRHHSKTITKTPT